MAEETRLVIETGGVLRNLLWISLQDDGAISVGFLSRPFVFDGFTSERDLEDGMRESTRVDLRATHSLKAITDPHFTLHPPAYFHLRSRKSEFLLEGLVWNTPGPGELVSPWIRFVSKRVRDLDATATFLPTKPTRIERLHVASDDASVAVNFDFVDERAERLPLVTERKAKVISWHETSMLVYARTVPAQPATLGYLMRG